MINLFNTNIKDKHDFILLNKDNGKRVNKTLTEISLSSPNQRSFNLPIICIHTGLISPPINSGMGIPSQQHNPDLMVLKTDIPTDQRSYLDAKAKAYKAEQANQKSINDLRHFSSALLERTSEVFKPITTNQDKNQQLLAKTLNQKIIAIKNKPEAELEIPQINEKTEPKHEDNGTLSKIECIDLIESDENIYELFGITKYNDYIIRFHIFLELYRHQLIENGIDHKIEFIEEIDRTLIKASRTKDNIVIKDISFHATRELIIALTKDIGIDFDKTVLEQYRLILGVCLKPELDKHIFKISQGRPSKIILIL